jgi:hypothetical protein
LSIFYDLSKRDAAAGVARVAPACLGEFFLSSKETQNLFVLGLIQTNKTQFSVIE